MAAISYNTDAEVPLIGSSRGNRSPKEPTHDDASAPSLVALPRGEGHHEERWGRGMLIYLFRKENLQKLCFIILLGVECLFPLV